MKKIYTLLLIVSLSILIGCSNRTETEIGKTKNTGGFEIIIKQMYDYKERDRIERKPPKNVVKVDIVVTNKSNIESGIGSLDFKAFDKRGKEISHYGYADSIGEVLQIGETLTGSIYIVAKKQDISTIKYIEPTTKKETTWRIGPSNS